MKVDEPFSHDEGPSRSLSFKRTFVPVGGGEDQSGKSRDSALTIKSTELVSQPKP
jgi:hypothetical protein